MIGILLGAVTPAYGVDVRILLIGSSHSAGIKPKLQSILDSVGITYTITAKTCNSAERRFKRRFRASDTRPYV